MTDLGDALRAVVGADSVRRRVLLAPLTTFRVGGPADWLIEPRTSQQIVDTLAVARHAGVPVTLLGGGSNVLVSDTGVRGLVIRPRGGEIIWTREGRVRADAAATVNGLVRWTIVHAAGGLEAWAGTPGTVGGAIAGNAHFSGQLIGDLVIEARLIDQEGRIADVPAGEMGFAYDHSRLRQSGEILLSATFKVAPGDPSVLRATARASLAYRKQTQPLDVPSAGCVFQNPERGRDAVPEGIPWSAGALVDRAGLKGVAIGGARVSPTHGNFILNEGTATAADIRRLIEHCHATVLERFGVDLKEEIVYLGEFATAASGSRVGS